MIFNNKTIKYIDIVFENCESAKIPKQYIEHITIGGINTWYSTFGNLYPELHVNYYTDFLQIHFKDLEKVIYKSFEEKTKISVLERIQKHKDITHIHFYFTDKSDLYLGTPWNSAKSKYINFHQILKIEKNNIYQLVFNERWNKEKIKNVIKYWLRYGLIIFKNRMKAKFRMLKLVHKWRKK